jgi:hypothetical protein
LGNRSPSREDATPTLCRYHRRYGARARKCTQPCSYSQQEKLTQRTSTVAYVCTPTNDRLFITDRISKRRFLIDVGSDLCVYPRKLIPRRRERVNYDFCTANGTTISNYGWLSLNLNLGLRRNFTWRFVAADITQPLIGVDFLSHFGLLVDYKHNRLLGRHSRFISVSRGTRTTSMVSTRPTSKVRDPHQPGERNHPSKSATLLLPLLFASGLSGGQSATLLLPLLFASGLSGGQHSLSMCGCFPHIFKLLNHIVIYYMGPQFGNHCC